MPRLDLATAIYRGADAASAVYHGARKVWPASAPAALSLTTTQNVMEYPLGSGTPNVPVPSVPALGDRAYFAIVAGSRNGSSPITWPTGFTQIAVCPSPDPGSLDDSMWIAERECDGTESGTWTATFGGGQSGDWLAIGALVSGVGERQSIGTNSHDATNGTTSITIIGPEVTTDDDHRAMVWITGSATGGSAPGAIASLTPPTGFTESLPRAQDGLNEYVSASLGVISSATTAMYSGSATFDVNDVHHTFVAAIVLTITGDVPPPEFVATTLDPDRKGAGIALSAGNLTVTANGICTVAALNPMDAATAANYWEITATAYSSALAFGVIPASATGFDNYLGDVAGVAWWTDATTNAVDATVLGDPPPVTAGDVCRIALIAGKLYVGIVGSGWWNTAAQDWTGDPANGVGALFADIAGDCSPAVSSYSGSNDQLTCNFGATTFAGDQPAGCTGWPLE